MNVALKTLVLLLPFVVLFVALRTCAAREGSRWEARVVAVDPAAKLVVDRDDLVVIAPDAAWGERAARVMTGFYAALVGNYEDLVGPGRDVQKVVVLFSAVDQLQKFAQLQSDDYDVKFLHGYTNPNQGAIFLPPGSSLDTLRHETVHLVMAQGYGTDVSYSPWLKEGLAQLFECYEPEASPPRPPGVARDAYEPGRLLQLLGSERFDVERLLAIQDYAVFVRRQDVFRNYAQAHVLAAFLLERRPRETFARYIALERARPEGRAEAFRGLYALDDAFQADLAGFVRDLTRR